MLGVIKYYTSVSIFISASVPGKTWVNIIKNDEGTINEGVFWVISPEALSTSLYVTAVRQVGVAI